MQDQLAFSPLKIRELLDAQHQSQEWLAEETGYSKEMISRYMTGKNPVSRKFAVRAANVLGVPLHWLLEEEATRAVA